MCWDFFMRLGLTQNGGYYEADVKNRAGEGV